MAEDAIAALLRARTIEAVAEDRATAELWLEQAGKHLEAAKTILAIDLSGAYSLLYDAARKSLAALMLAEGYRARSVPGAHKAIGTYAEAILGAGAQAPDVKRFDTMRRNRNRSEYGTRHFGEAEVRKDLEHAQRIREAVRVRLRVGG